MALKGMTVNPDGSLKGWDGEPGVPLAKRALETIRRMFWG